jgi:nucleotide-binding universal stress UspA family protein
MSDYRIILSVLSDAESGQAVFDAALMLGRDYKSHITALHVKSDPTSAIPLVGEGMSGAMVEEMLTEAERESSDRAAGVRRIFDNQCQHYAIPVENSLGQGGELTASWREEKGNEDSWVAKAGRVSDLIVAGQPSEDSDLPSSLSLTAGLLETGRPIMMTPGVAPIRIGKRVAIAWNGSAEAARAVAAALPILKRAEAVTVLTIAEGNDVLESDAEGLAAYLAAHGATASLHSFSAEGHSAGEAILHEVGVLGCDLLVMGAFTHSRLRQLIFGGVTRHIVSHARLPVLMTH